MKYTKKIFSLLLILTLLINTMVSTGFSYAFAIPETININQLRAEIMSDFSDEVTTKENNNKKELSQNAEKQIEERYNKLNVELNEKIKAEGLANNIILAKILKDKEGYGRLYTILNIMGAENNENEQNTQSTQEEEITLEEIDAFYKAYEKEINEIFTVWEEKYKETAKIIAEKVINNKNTFLIEQDNDILIEFLPYIKEVISEEDYKKILEITREQLKDTLDICINKGNCDSAYHLLANRRYMYLDGQEAKYKKEILDDSLIITDAVRKYSYKIENTENYVGLVGISSALLLSLKEYGGIRRIIQDAKKAEEKISKDEEPMTNGLGGLEALMPGTVIYAVAEETDSSRLYTNRISSLPSEKGRYIMENGKAGDIWWDLADMLGEEGSEEAQKILESEISEIVTENGKIKWLGLLGSLKISALLHRKASKDEKKYEDLAKGIINVRYGDLTAAEEKELDKSLLARYSGIKDLGRGAVVDAKGISAKEKATANMADLRKACKVIDIAVLVVSFYQIFRIGLHLIKSARNIGIGFYKTMKAGRIAKTSGKAAQLKFIRQNIKEIDFYKNWKAGMKNYQANMLTQGGKVKIAPAQTGTVKPQVKNSELSNNSYMYVEEGGKTYKLTTDAKGKIKKTEVKSADADLNSSLGETALNKVRKSNLNSRQKRKVRRLFQAEKDAESEAKVQEILDEMVKEGLTPKDSKGVRYNELNWLNRKIFDFNINKDFAGDFAADLTGALIGNPKRAALTATMLGTGEAPIANAFINTPIEMTSGIKAPKVIRGGNTFNLYDPNSFFGGGEAHAGSGKLGVGRVRAELPLNLAPRVIRGQDFRRKLIQSAAGITAFGLILNEFLNPSGNMFDLTNGLTSLAMAAVVSNVTNNSKKQTLDNLPQYVKDFINLNDAFSVELFEGKPLTEDEANNMREILSEDFFNQWQKYYGKHLKQIAIENHEDLKDIIKYSNMFETRLPSMMYERFKGTNPLYIFTMRDLMNDFITDLNADKDIKTAMTNAGSKMFEYHKKINQIEFFLTKKHKIYKDIVNPSEYSQLNFEALEQNSDIDDFDNFDLAERLGYGILNNTDKTGIGVIISPYKYSEYYPDVLRTKIMPNYKSWEEYYQNMRTYRGVKLSTPTEDIFSDIMVIYPNAYYEGVHNNDLAFNAMQENWEIIKPLIKKYQKGTMLSNTEINTLHDNIADMSFILTNAVPFYRGTAALNQLMVYGLYQMAGIDAPAVKLRRSLDLSAFTSTPEQYKNNWLNLFSEPFPNQKMTAKAKIKNFLNVATPFLISGSLFGLNYLFGGDNILGLTLAAAPFIGNVNINNGTETVYGETLTFQEYMPDWKEKLSGFTAKELAAFERAITLTEAKFNDPKFEQWSYEEVLEENLNSVLTSRNISLKNNKRTQLLDSMNRQGFQTYYKYRSYIKFLQLYKQNPGDNAKTPTKEKALARAIKRLKEDPRIGYPLILELNDLWANNANAKKNKTDARLLNIKEEYIRFVQENDRNPSTISKDDYEKALAKSVHQTIINNKKIQDNPIVIEIKNIWAQYSNKKKMVSSPETWLERYKVFLETYNRNPSKTNPQNSEEAALGIALNNIQSKNKDFYNTQIAPLWEKHKYTGDEDTVIKWFNAYSDFIKKHERNPQYTESDKEEYALARHIKSIMADKKYKDSPIVQQINQLWTKTELNEQVEKWTILYTELQEYIKENGHVPSVTYVNNKEARRLKMNYLNAINNSIDHPIITQLKDLWNNSDTSKEDYQKQYQEKQATKYLTLYKEFVAKNNRNPKTINEEQTLYKNVKKFMNSDLPIAVEFQNIWVKYEAISGLETKKKEVINNLLNEYKEFLQNNGRNPNYEIEKEKRLYRHIYNLRKNPDPMYQEFRDLWTQYNNQRITETKAATDIEVTQKWLSAYKKFLQEHNRNPKGSVKDEFTIYSQVLKFRKKEGEQYQEFRDLWNKYLNAESEAETDGKRQKVFEEYTAFLAENNRNPKNNLEEVNLYHRVRKFVNNDDPKYQEFRDLWTQYDNLVLSKKETKEINYWLGKYKEFVAKNGINPNNHIDSPTSYLYKQVLKYRASDIQGSEEFRTLWIQYDTQATQQRETHYEEIKAKTAQELLEKYKNFLQEYGRNPHSNIQEEQSLYNQVSRYRHNLDDNYDEFRTLWRKYKGKKGTPTKTVKTETNQYWIEELQNFVAENNRLPILNSENADEILLRKKINYIRTKGTNSDPLIIQINEIFNNVEIEQQKAKGEALVAQLNQFITENGHTPSSSATESKEEKHLAKNISKYINKANQDDPYALELIKITKAAQKQSKAEADLQAQQQLLDEYKEFLKQNNRNPSATNDNEYSLIRRIRQVLNLLIPANPVVTELRALWTIYDVKAVKPVKTTAEWLEDYKEFLADNKGVNPNYTSKNKEERTLARNILTIIKTSDIEDPDVYKLTTLWALHSRAMSHKDWLINYNIFVKENERTPKPSGRYREKMLYYAAHYIADNTPKESALRQDFAEIFEEIENNKPSVIKEENAAGNIDMAEASFQDLYINYLNSNNLGKTETIALPQTQAEKDAVIENFKQFIEDNDAVPSLYTDNADERYLALVLQSVKGDLNNFDTFAATLVNMASRKRATTVSDLYAQTKNYIENKLTYPNQNSKLYKAVYYRLYYGTADDKDLDDLGDLYALHQLSQAISMGQIYWNEDFEMVFDDNVVKQTGISNKELSALYNSLPVKDRRVFRDMAAKYQDIKANYSKWLEGNKANIIWTDETKQALQNVNKEVANNNAQIIPFVAALQNMKLGQEGFGPAYYLIFRGKDLKNINVQDFHFVLERPGLLIYEEPSQNVTFTKDLGKVTGLVLSKEITPQEVTEALKQLTKNGTYTLRMMEQDFGIEDGKLNANGLAGKLQFHLDKLFPFPDKDGYITDVSTLINIDASALTKGKTEAEILAIYKNLFPGFVK